MAKKRPERGEYRGIFVALADDPDFQNLSMEAQWVFFALKLRLGRSGIDVFYPAALADQFGKGSGNPSGNPYGNPYERVTEAIAELIAEGWVKNERNVYWIRNGLRHDPAEPLKVPNMRTSIEAHLKTLPKLAIVNEMALAYELTVPFPDLDTARVPVTLTATLPARDAAPRKTEDGRRKEETGDKSPEAAPRLFEGDPEPDKLAEPTPAEIHATLAPLIRKHFWLGSEPPGGMPGKKPITMDRELHVAKQLVAKYSLPEVAGAIECAREAMGVTNGRRLSMLGFNTKGELARFHMAVALWRERKEREAGALVTDLVKRIGNRG